MVHRGPGPLRWGPTGLGWYPFRLSWVCGGLKQGEGGVRGRVSRAGSKNGLRVPRPPTLLPERDRGRCDNSGPVPFQNPYGIRSAKIKGTLRFSVSDNRSQRTAKRARPPSGRALSSFSRCAWSRGCYWIIPAGVFAQELLSPVARAVQMLFAPLWQMTLPPALNGRTVGSSIGMKPLLLTTPFVPVFTLLLPLVPKHRARASSPPCRL